MLNTLVKLSLFGLNISVICGVFSSPILAQETPKNSPQPNEIILLKNQYKSKTFSSIIGTNNTPMSQVTNVNQLRDVEPTDWAYEALKNLVERYGCIVGYPDQTYRGDRPLTRWEFAAGLNACLNTLERLIQEGVSVAQEDLEKLKRLSQEFTTELTALGTRIENLESRVAFLEDHQFSTTTKLQGETIFAFSQVFGNENAATGGSLDTQVVLNYRARLHLVTSFNGEDRLRIRLQGANYPFGRGGSNFTDYNFSSNTDNTFVVDKAEYRFPVGEKLMVWVTGGGMNLDDVADPLAPFASPYTTGSISFFGSEAPIYYTSFGSGAAFSYNFTDAFSVVGYYSAENAENPTVNNGLFNGQYVAATQLTYLPSPNTGVAFVYTHTYAPTGENIMGFTGSARAENPFDSNLITPSNPTGTIIPTYTDNFALVWTWKLAPQFNLEGWGMYSTAYATGASRRGDKADIWNWKLTFAFPDLLKEGNVGLLSVGNPPKAYSISNSPEDEDVSWFVELLYVYQLNDNISISPGIFVVTSPGDNRDPLWVGTIRTSFEF